MRDSYRVVRGWIARINAFLQENITGMATVQLFRREALNFARFDEIDREHRDANIESIFYYAVFYPAIEAVSALASALIIWYGGGERDARRADARRAGRVPAVLAALLPADQRHVGEVQRPAVGDGLVGADLQAARRAGRRSQSPPLPRVARPAPAAGHIVFDSVWFAYNDGDRRTCCKDVSFEVRPGQRVGIVGATGSGKTTLINLLLRFYDVKRGRITIDGVDVRELDLADLRGLFSLVLQDVHLFSGTIADNIRLGNAGDRRRRRCGARPRRCMRTRSSSGCPSGYGERGRRARRRRCRSARSSCCRSRARWRSIRAC